LFQEEAGIVQAVVLYFILFFDKFVSRRSWNCASSSFIFYGFMIQGWFFCFVENWRFIW